MQNLKRSFFFVLIGLFIATLFTSCSSVDKQEKRAHFEPYIISTEADTSEELLDTAVYEETAYLLSKDKIVTYDLISGERTVVVEAAGNTTVCADEKYIYTYNKEQNAVIMYDKKGKIKETYSCSFEPIEADIMSVFDETVVISSKFNNPVVPSSKLYKLDLSSGENSMVSGYKGEDTFSLIFSLDFIDKNTIMVTSLANPSMTNPITKGYKYDLQKDKQLVSIIIPTYSTCYDPAKKCFYYTYGVGFGSTDDTTKTSIQELGTSVREFYPDTSIIMTSSSISGKTLRSFSNNKDSFMIDRIFYTDDAFIFRSIFNNCFLVIDRTTDKEPLNIMITENTFLSIRLPIIISQFEAEYNYPVHIIEYPEEVFADKLRTKLLAGDKDFDIVLINNPTKDNLLSSILSHDLYEPLDGYDGIVSNFSEMYDGIRSMMSYKGKLFGVPNWIYVDTNAIQFDLSQYGCTITGKNWTDDELWKLCDGIIKSGDQDVSVFFNSNIILGFIDDFIQDAINNNNLDMAALTELLKTINKYDDAGILIDHDYSPENPGSKKHLLSPVLIDLSNLIYGTTPDYPEYGTVTFPQYDGKNYFNLSTCTFINKFSTNKDMAAKFLEVMTKSENFYNTEIYQNALLGPDLTKYDKYNEWSDKMRLYLSDLSSIYETSGFYTYDIGAINRYIIDNIMPGFFDGSLSPEKAAEMLYEQINYTYFE